MKTPSLHFLSLDRLKQEFYAFLYALGFGYFVSEAEAYRLFETMLRLHNYRRAAGILRVASRRYPRGEDVESMCCTLAIRDGDLERGLPLLTARLEQGDRRAVERLLFRTGSRPRDLAQRSHVFGLIAASPLVDLTHRCYALIAQAYLVLRSGDKELAASLRPQLRRLIEELDAEPQALSCAERNRSNLTKLLISLHTAGYHLALQASDLQACALCWREALALSERIDYSRLNADAGLRMTSNLCRCLTLGLLVERDGQSDPLPLTLAALDSVQERVLAHCLAPDRRGRRLPQENHLEVLKALQEACRELCDQPSARRQAVLRRCARLLNHSSNPALTEVILERLSALHAVAVPLPGRSAAAEP